MFVVGSGMTDSNILNSTGNPRVEASAIPPNYGGMGSLNG